MLLPECIKIAKGERFKAKKEVITLIEASPEDLSINKEGETMEWLYKCNHRDIQEKGQLIKNQEFIFGDLLDLQDYIGRGGRDT